MVRRKGSLNPEFFGVKISIIGAGRVGTTLAVLLHRKEYRIVSIISRRQASAKRAAALVGCKLYSHSVSDLHPATNFLLIATADESIQRVAQEVSATAPLNFSRLYAAHTSGLLSSDELRPLARKGATVFSFHPIQSFPQSNSLSTQLHAMNGISYGVEGSPRAVRFARQLASRLGGHILQVPKEQKILYHLACVFASNYSVALLGAVEELVKGFVPAPRLRHFRKLIESSIDNGMTLSAQKGLTGPIARGSTRSVVAHLKALHKHHRNIKTLYKSVGLYTLQLAQRDRKISPSKTKQLRKILSA